MRANGYEKFSLCHLSASISTQIRAGSDQNKIRPSCQTALLFYHSMCATNISILSIQMTKEGRFYIFRTQAHNAYSSRNPFPRCLVFEPSGMPLTLSRPFALSFSGPNALRPCEIRACKPLNRSTYVHPSTRTQALWQAKDHQSVLPNAKEQVGS